MRLDKSFVAIAIFTAAFSTVGGLRSVRAADGTAQIQKELEATKTAAQKAESDLQKAQAEATAAEQKLAKLKTTIQSAKARATELNLRQQTLLVKLQDSRAADRLTGIADTAKTVSEKAFAVRNEKQLRLRHHQQQLAMHQSKVLQTTRLIKDLEAKLKPQQAAVAKTKAAKEAADKSAAAPRKTIADATSVVTLKKTETSKIQTKIDSTEKTSTAVRQATTSLKTVVAMAQQAAAAAKGTPAEKAAADSVVAQQTAVQKVADVASLLAAKLKALEAKLTTAKTAQSQSEAKLKTVTDAAKPQLDAAAKADAGLTAANKVLTQTQKAIADAKVSLADATKSYTAQETQIATFTPEVEKAVSEYEMLNTKTIELRKQAELKLIAADRMVSFSDKVAPIFAERCLACHNARIAKGRYNMESFSGINKGGESGGVIEHGNADDSYLFSLIADGEMPKDADPLSKDEIEIIRKWIDTGASLNAGVDRSARLIQITPTVPQPMPPETYRVPMPVTAVAFSADGNRLATSGYHEVLIWDAQTGQQLQRVTNIAERVYDIEFAPDGKTFAVAAGTPAKIGELKVFRNDGELLANMIRTDDSVFSADYSTDGKRLASAGADRTIRVFETATFTEQLRIEDHADWVIDVAWSPDGKRLASASRDKTAKVFDAVTGDSIVTFSGHGQPVFGVGFLPDGKTVVSGGGDKTLRVWNVSDAKEKRKIGGFGNEVFRIHVTTDGFVYSSSADQIARLHQLSDGKETRKFTGHSDWVYSVAYSSKTKRVATGSYDGEVRIWNSDDGKSLLDFVATPQKAPKKAASN